MIIRRYIEALGHRDEDGLFIIKGAWLTDDQVNAIVNIATHLALSLPILVMSTGLCIALYGGFDHTGSLYANFGATVCPDPESGLRGRTAHPSIYLCVNWAEFFDQPLFAQILILCAFSSALSFIVNATRGLILAISVNVQQER